MGRLGNVRTLAVLTIVGTAATVVTDVKRIVSGRARQLIHLKRYHLWAQTGYVPTQANQSFTTAVILQVHGRDWGVAPQDIFRPAIITVGANVPSYQGMVDWLYRNETFIGTLADGTGFPGQYVTDLVVECDIVVPALHLYGTTRGTVVANLTTGIAVEYEWISASPDEIAAVNLVWGQDPQDFDRG